MVELLLVMGCVLGQAESIDATKYAPIYSEHGDHAWDAVYKSFFVRTFTTGEAYYHRWSFDVPWNSFQRLSREEAAYSALLRQLDAVDHLAFSDMEGAAPIRRLVFFRDLWAVFERLESMASQARGTELRQRIARIMRRLELTYDEIPQLPDTLALIRANARFEVSLDPKHPEQPFLPTTLLHEPSEWIALSAGKHRHGGAPAHTTSVNQRSLFSIHMRWPDGRAAGEKYLAANSSQDNFQFPPGTQLALLRRALAATTSGSLKVTNVVESLQLLQTPEADSKNDYRIKFVLDRSELLRGQSGLKPLELNSPIDAFSFESTGQWMSNATVDADGELLVLGRGTGHVGIPSMQHCVACHGLKNTRFHANFGTFFVHVTSNADLARALELSKQESESWQNFRKLAGHP